MQMSALEDQHLSPLTLKSNLRMNPQKRLRSEVSKTHRSL